MNAVGSPDNVVLAGKNQPPLAPIIANLVLECALTLQALLRQNLLLPIIPKQIRSSALTQTNSVSRNLPRLVLNTCLSDEGSQLASTPPPRELPDREAGTAVRIVGGSVMDDATESAPEKDRVAMRAPRAGADRGRRIGSTPIQPLPSLSGAERIVRPSKLPTILSIAPPT